MKWLGAAGWLLHYGDTTIAIDPFFHRPPEARPTLPIGRDELPTLDYLLITHCHWDHFADAPHLAATNARHSYVPAKAIRDLEKAWKRTPTALRRHTKSWHGVVGGECIELDGLRISFHRIGTERFDLWMLRNSIAKLRETNKWADYKNALAFLASHILGKCFAVVFHFTETGRKLAFFGNLTRRAGELAAAHPDIDIAVLPYCPANGDWLDESVCLIGQLEPRAVLVHHFDQFLPPVTVGLDMPEYVRQLKRKAPGMPVHLPKFFKEFSLDGLLGGQAQTPATARR